MDKLHIFIFLLLLSSLFISCTKSNSSKISEPEVEDFWSSRSKPQHLSLAVKHNGEIYYLSVSDTHDFADSLRVNTEILGVVIDAQNVDIRFVVALDDCENGNGVTHSAAIAEYGKSLPSKAEADLIMEHYDALSNAIVNFGGEPLSKQRGKDQWWTEDGYLFGYCEIMWDYSGVKAKVRKTITLYNPYSGEIMPGQKSSIFHKK